jgi:hypothetical protein
VLITLGPETMEHLLSSRLRSGTSPSAMTHYNYSIRFPFIISFVPRFTHIICTIVINPRPWVCGYYCPALFASRIELLSPRAMILPALSLIYPSLFPHSPLSLSARAVFSHAIVTDFGCTAQLVCHRAQPPLMPPFMPHSLSPMPFTLMTHAS